MKYLLLISQGSDAFHDHTIFRPFLDIWHERCKSLQVVQLPTKLYVHGGRFGWIDMDANDLSLEEYRVLAALVKNYVKLQLERL